MSQTKVDYQKDIVPIIISNCNLSGCHSNGSTTGDFTAYEGLKEKIVSGKFQLMVFDLKLMPPVTREDLSRHDLEVLKRWVEQGYRRD